MIFKYRILLGGILVIIVLLCSCIPTIHKKYIKNFRNCTIDTLIVGASHINNFDSMEILLWPRYLVADSGFNNTNNITWNGYKLDKYIIYPDSLCGVDADYLFDNTDTCFFFLIRWDKINLFSWEEIRDKKLYNRWIVTRDEEGMIDRNIRYQSHNASKEYEDGL